MKDLIYKTCGIMLGISFPFYYCLGKTLIYTDNKRYAAAIPTALVAIITLPLGSIGFVGGHILNNLEE